MKKALAWILALTLLCAQAYALAAPAEDRMGNPIAVPETVSSIVSLSPSVTQVIIDLGFADRLVAVDTYSAGTKGLPADLPAFDMMTPDMERLAALAPDVVLVSGMGLVEGIDEKMAKITALGICVAYVPSSNMIADILEDNLFIGALLGDEDGAAALNAPIAEALAAMPAPDGSAARVYFELNPAPTLYSFGSGVFLNEIVELLGGKNIFADQQSWLSVSEESVIAADPEIIFTNADWNENPVEEILNRPGWANVSAVRNKRVYLIGSDTSSQPNHRIIAAIDEMRAAFTK